MAVEAVFLDKAVFDDRSFPEALKAALFDVDLLPAFIARVEKPVCYIGIDGFGCNGVADCVVFRPPFMVPCIDINPEFTAFVFFKKLFPFPGRDGNGASPALNFYCFSVLSLENGDEGRSFIFNPEVHRCYVVRYYRA